MYIIKYKSCYQELEPLRFNRFRYHACLPVITSALSFYYIFFNLLPCYSWTTGGTRGFSGVNRNYISQRLTWYDACKNKLQKVLWDGRENVHFRNVVGTLCWREKKSSQKNIFVDERKLYQERMYHNVGRTRHVQPLNSAILRSLLTILRIIKNVHYDYGTILLLLYNTIPIGCSIAKKYVDVGPEKIL